MSQSETPTADDNAQQYATRKRNVNRPDNTDPAARTPNLSRREKVPETLMLVAGCW